MKNRVYFTKRKDLESLEIGLIDGIKLFTEYEGKPKPTIFEGKPVAFDMIEIVKPFLYKGGLVSSIDVEYINLKKAV